MPAIPDKFDWARDEQPISTHTTGVAGFFRFCWAQMMLAGIALAIGLGLLTLHFTKGPQTNTLLPGLIIAVLSIPLLAWAIFRFQQIIHEVRIYPDGVLWRAGGRWNGWRWEEIEQVLRTEVSVNGGTSIKHVVLKSHGKSAILEHALSSWDRMAKRIQTETTMRLLPVAIEEFSAGETVRFGSVSLGLEGLTIEKKLVPFDEMKDVRINNGTLIVFLNGRKGDVKTAALGDISNYLVFLKLLEASEAPGVRLGVD